MLLLRFGCRLPASEPKSSKSPSTVPLSGYKSYSQARHPTGLFATICWCMDGYTASCRSKFPYPSRSAAVPSHPSICYIHFLRRISSTLGRATKAKKSTLCQPTRLAFIICPNILLTNLSINRPTLHPVRHELTLSRLAKSRKRVPSAVLKSTCRTF